MTLHRPTLLLLCSLLLSLSAAADDVRTFGRWKVTYVADGHTLKYNYQEDDGFYRPIFVRSVPEATYDNVNGVSRHVTILDFSSVAIESSDVDDAFGSGTRTDYVFSRPSNGDAVSLTEHVWYYPSKDYLLVSLELAGPGLLRSNYLSPVNCSNTYTLFASNGHNRMLKVPYDNDGFLRYYRYPMAGSMMSYEASSFYEGDSRNGLVVGSVDHDHWKSAIQATMSGNGKMESLKLFSGVANSETRDLLPHGKLVGDTISSARFFVGFFDDWRDGMETFAAACNIVQPRRNNWVDGRPVGWQTWGVLEKYNNYLADKENFQYFHDVLQPAGFTNGTGRQIMSIDAWTNLSVLDERNLIAQADTLDLVVGCYGNPFCIWWDTSDPSCLEQIYYSSSLSSYKAKDVVLRANGKPIVYDGAYCLDPTHPAVKATAAAWIRQQLAMGYRYFKLDFVTNGIMEADSYYNPNVHTGVEAYNEGFTYYNKQLDKCQEPVFVNLGIAPIFPYHYGNGRRQICDTWSTISWTEYSMNAITAGWWTNGLYQYNDADGLPMVGHGDQGGTTLAENRSRLTNGIVSGHVLLSDNFSLNDRSGRGNPQLSRLRANSLFTNADVNEMLAFTPNFRPVYGYNEYGGSAGGSEATVMMTTEEYYYVVVFNYNSDINRAPLTGTLPLADLGITASDFSSVKELWTHAAVDATNGLSYSIPSRDCRIYRFTRIPQGIESPSVAEPSVTVAVGQGMLTLRSLIPIRSVSFFDASGRCLDRYDDDCYHLTLPLPEGRGVTIVRTVLSDGTTQVDKIVIPQQSL